MGTNKLKPGDRVMFLGIYDSHSTYKFWAKTSKLIPLKVYIVSSITKSVNYRPPGIYLKGVSLWHHQRYFQKVEENYGN